MHTIYLSIICHAFLHTLYLLAILAHLVICLDVANLFWICMYGCWVFVSWPGRSDWSRRRPGARVSPPDAYAGRAAGMHDAAQATSGRRQLAAND